MSRDQHKPYPVYWFQGSKQSIQNLYSLRETWRENGDRIVTTNGCFDLIHPGHIQFLSMAKEQGNKLIVGINSDRSVRKIKGEGKPIMSEEERAVMLSALRSVDAVLIFDDLLPNSFLEEVQPDIHCKAGDYSEESLPEGEIVKRNGGTISILPLIEGFSSSDLLGRIQSAGKNETRPLKSPSTDSRSEQILTYLLSSSNLFRQSAYGIKDLIETASQKVNESLSGGHKILLCGNGGSAADSQHIAAELVGRFRKNRSALPAVALTTDTSILTAVANDYGFDQIFSRQVEALGQPGDLLIAISTSGNSENVVKAAEEAKKRGLFVLGFTGTSESKLSSEADLCLRIPSDDTALIQQVHLAILHLLCDLAEKELFG